MLLGSRLLALRVELFNIGSRKKPLSAADDYSCFKLASPRELAHGIRT